ncbi:MAG: lamin tail domain-containing protein [Bacteroidota bacterium]
MTLTDVLIETPPGVTLVVSEVAAWSSGNSPVGADWFELTNTGTNPVDITGWKVDDNSNSFTAALVLNGITTIASRRNSHLP